MTEASTGLVDETDDVALDEITVDERDRDPQPAPTITMTRAQRERVRRARNRRHELLAAAVALVIGAIAALVTSPLHASHAPVHRPATVAAPTAARPHTLLLVHYGRDGRIDLAALVGVDANARNGSFVFIPAPTVAEVPALELQPIGSLLRVGDHTLLLDVIENATGVRIDRSVVFEDNALARTFAAAPPLTITFPHPLRVADASGTLSYPAGRVTGVLPSDAVRLLEDRESGGTLLHLATVQAVMEGYFDALRSSPAAAARARAVRGAAPFVALTSVQQMHYDVIPVDSSDATGGERFDIRDADLAQMVAADFPFARLGGDGPRPRIELLNGVGTAGLTQRVARIVIPHGGYVSLTNNVEGFGQRVTRVLYYQPSDYATARRFAKVLGVTSVVFGSPPVDSVDITVVIGSDFLRKHS